MPTAVRPANAADVPALMSLFSELHPNDPPVPAQVAQQVWQRISAQSGRTILVAERDAVVGGTVDCAVLPNLTRGGRPFMLIENVVVSAALRRTGVGSLLFAAAIELAKQEDCYKIQLMTGSKQESVHAFYQAQGLKPAAQGYRLYL